MTMTMDVAVSPMVVVVLLVAASVDGLSPSTGSSLVCDFTSKRAENCGEICIPEARQSMMWNYYD